ncbi:MAG: MBL fold metallo-hydrolase [Chloroflexi bacterium]|nr:MBL fold metallo-hydrolase [Chloroflexota bacterium]|tara:strand:+ start:5415 stop:6797 length:1383 start_codon:yes stop_codon:yes gene_type:complete
MTSLTFYGGVNEIGGNKILLEDKDTKVFLDFGMSFGKRGAYFDEFMSPRVSTGLKDFIEMGLVPNLQNVYRTDLLKMMDRTDTETDIDAVLLSHAHADHADYISFLNENIPVYMGDTCKLILEAIQMRSASKFEREILSFKPRPTDRKEDPIERDIQTFRTGDKFKIGSLEVEPIHVDHSVPGAYGFIIYTSSGPVVYTADIRLHGTNPKMTEDFIKKAVDVKPIALLAEGTRINDLESDESEQKVYSECNTHVSNTDKLAIADFNFKDMDRLRTFYNIAKENNRKFVVNVNDVPFLEHLSKDPQLNVPKIDDENLKIFEPKKSTRKKFEREYLENLDVINAEELATQQGQALCAFSFWHFGALIDMKPTPGALYMHSLSEPWNDEGKSDQKRVNLWLDHFGLNRVQSHCSGHSKGQDLLDIVKDIDSDMLFPIHTESPESYKKVTEKLTIVQEAKKYEL